MYEKISGLLIPKVIRDSGGFYDAAKKLSMNENSKVTFSMIPMESSSLLQLKLSIVYPDAASQIDHVNPLEFFSVNELQRSNYFLPIDVSVMLLANV